MKPLALIAVLTLLILPGVAAAAGSSHAVVVSVAAGGREIQVVDAGHAVRAFRVRVLSSASGRRAAHAANSLAIGSVIAYRQMGSVITDVHVTGRSRAVSYYASVIRSSARRIVVRLADGRKLTLAASRLRLSRHLGSGSTILAHAAAAPGAVGHDSPLPAGTTVLVTESVSQGVAAHFSITLPSPSGAGAAASSDTARQLAQG